MRLILLPQKSFDKETAKSLGIIKGIAEKLLVSAGISVPKSFEFYNSFDKFVKRNAQEVIDYGFPKNIASDFIKSSLHTSTYGNYDFKRGVILEMNSHPYFKEFYPAQQLLELIIHESLHLELRKKMGFEINKLKFKFMVKNKTIKYAGIKKVLQLDEGFATVFSKLLIKTLPKSNLQQIRKLAVWTSSKKLPAYKKSVGRYSIEKLVSFFNKTFEENSKKGVKIIYGKLKKIREKGIKSKIQSILDFVNEEIKSIASEHIYS